ncbi:MAG: GNAT family N-acetyltransferase [Planctomycetes bacterium]|nr:GNAT family N-acetyltransferase [Planctomycetota bacterium]
MDIDVHPCATPGERAAALTLRRAVFVAEQGVPAELELDDDDARAIHLVAIVDAAVVGAARLVVRGDGTIKVGRVCVRRDARGRGIGRALMAAAHDQARTLGRRRIVLHAQLTVSGFYRDLGYAVVGPPFVEAGIAHERMEFDLG